MDIDTLPILIASKNDPKWYIEASKKMCSDFLAKHNIYLTDEYINDSKNVVIDESKNKVSFRAKNGWISILF